MKRGILLALLFILFVFSACSSPTLASTPSRSNLILQYAETIEDIDPYGFIGEDSLTLEEADNRMSFLEDFSYEGGEEHVLLYTATSGLEWENAIASYLSLDGISKTSYLYQSYPEKDKEEIASLKETLKNILLDADWEISENHDWHKQVLDLNMAAQELYMVDGTTFINDNTSQVVIIAEFGVPTSEYSVVMLNSVNQHYLKDLENTGYSTDNLTLEMVDPYNILDIDKKPEHEISQIMSEDTVTEFALVGAGQQSDSVSAYDNQLNKIWDEISFIYTSDKEDYYQASYNKTFNNRSQRDDAFDDINNIVLYNSDFIYEIDSESFEFLSQQYASVGKLEEAYIYEKDSSTKTTFLAKFALPGDVYTIALFSENAA